MKFRLHVPTVSARWRGIVPILNLGNNPDAQPKREALIRYQKLYSIASLANMPEALPKLQTASAAKTIELVLQHLSGAHPVPIPSLTINQSIIAALAGDEAYKATRKLYRTVIAQLHRLEGYVKGRPAHCTGHFRGRPKRHGGRPARHPGDANNTGKHKLGCPHPGRR